MKTRGFFFGFAGLLAACGTSKAAPVPSRAGTEPELHVPPMPSAPDAAAPAAPATVIAKADPKAKRAKELFDHADWIGAPIQVEIYEPLYDADHSSAADAGGYDIQVADVGPKRLGVTPAQSPAEKAAGALAALAADLRPPIRVRGVLGRSRIGLRIIAHEIEQLSFPEPTRVTSAQLLGEPTKWSGRYVEIEDTWLSGFEASFLGKSGVWLDFYPSITIRCAPPKAPSRDRSATSRPVRVVGYAYTEGHYGHLGSGSAEVVATQLVHLDPKRPDCR